MRPYADLFLLGVGFLLLKTKSVTGFALLFGTTWVVNSIVFAGVLIAVLAAVEVTRRFRTPPIRVMYVVLFVGLLLAWLVPTRGCWPCRCRCGLSAAVTVAFLPIFAANVVFAKRFTDTEDGTAAFGANLLGAMVGGCLEYLGLIVGFPGLLVIAAPGLRRRAGPDAPHVPAESGEDCDVASAGRRSRAGVTAVGAVAWPRSCASRNNASAECRRPRVCR